MKLVNKFKVGCDPEFVVMDGNGCIVNVSKLGAGGAVGYDHSGFCAELRPEEARGTYAVVRRLQKLLRTPYPNLRQFQSLKWRSGAFIKAPNRTITLGGHIHFGLTQDQLPKGALKALDKITVQLEKLDILPLAESSERRRGSEYGAFSQIRVSETDGHVEYRTMASWLRSPWVAFTALTLAKLALCDPQGAAELPTAGEVSMPALVRFVERFRDKDNNADRLLAKFEKGDKFLRLDADGDIKTAWSEKLSRNVV